MTDDQMTPDELLAKINADSIYFDYPHPDKEALRAVVELANQPLDTENMPTQEVAWYTTGYNVALVRVLDAIAKALE